MSLQAKCLASAGLLLPVLTALTLGLLLADPFRQTRSFVIEARTRSATITFIGGTNHWDLGTVTLCSPRPRLDPRAAPQSHCNPARYAESRTDLSLSWPEGAQVQITDDPQRGLSLRLSGSPEAPDGTLVWLTPEAFARLGTLSFIGHLILGRSALSGEGGLLISGSYEARERPLFSRSTEAVKTGILRNGDSVTLREGNGPALVFGHFSPPAEQDQHGFQLTAISAPGRTALEISYFGGKEPNLIRPNWVDRALSSPLLIAGLFLLSTGAGQIQLLLASLERLRAGREQPAPARPRRPRPRLRRWRR